MTWIINIIQIHHLNNIDATVVAQISLYFLFERVENWIKKKKKKIAHTLSVDALFIKAIFI